MTWLIVLGSPAILSSADLKSSSWAAGLTLGTYDHQAGMKISFLNKPLEILGVVRDEHELFLLDQPAQLIVLGAGSSEIDNVVCLIAGRVSYFDEALVKTLVDQKPQAAASPWCQGCLGGRPRLG